MLIWQPQKCVLIQNGLHLSPLFHYCCYISDQSKFYNFLNIELFCPYAEKDRGLGTYELCICTRRAKWLGGGGSWECEKTVKPPFDHFTPESQRTYCKLCISDRCHINVNLCTTKFSLPSAKNFLALLQFQHLNFLTTFLTRTSGFE